MSAGRRDAAWSLAALLLLLAWEASGGDLALARRLASPAGFAWRDAPLLTALHDGGRLLAWALLAALAFDTARPFGAAGPLAPPRRRRALWLAVVLATAVLVPAIKRFSHTSRPWDLAPFGGQVPYVPHWLLTVTDGGPGHCFPSGHAAGVLAFIGVYFLWRDHRPPRARALALAVWALGAVYGAVQLLRGAHFLSHVLWAAWACWALAAGVAALLAWQDRLRGTAGLSRRTGRRLRAAPVAPGLDASTPLPWPRARAACVEDNPAG